jgi:hypothetical protein
MAARRLFDGAEFEVGGLALESPAALTFNEIVTDGRTPILWWKLDDASDPADDAAAADNDGILTGTGLFGATAFFPTPNGTVFDTNGGTGYLTSEADSPVSGEDWTMFIFWQLNDAGTVGAIYDTLSAGHVGSAPVLRHRRRTALQGDHRRFGDHRLHLVGRSVHQHRAAHALLRRLVGRLRPGRLRHVGHRRCVGRLRADRGDARFHCRSDHGRQRRRASSPSANPTPSSLN